MRHLLLRSVFLLVVFTGRMLIPLCDLTGVNSESSFEADLLKRAPGCEVWGYDYSVDAVRVPCLFFNEGPYSLSSGDLRLMMTPSLRLVPISKRGRLEGPTTIRSTIIPSIGQLIR